VKLIEASRKFDNLQVMSGDRVGGVSLVFRKFDSQASAASDFMSLHSSQELSTLSCKHWPNDQLNATSSESMS